MKKFLFGIVALVVALCSVVFVGCKEQADGSVSVTVEICNIPSEFYAEFGADKDGYVLKEYTVDFVAGATVFSVTEKALGDNGLTLGTSGDGENEYVREIAGLADTDARFGEMPGWTFTVNDEWSLVGAGAAEVKDGYKIVWSYVLSWD